MAPLPISTEIQSRKPSSRAQELPAGVCSSIQPAALGKVVRESFLHLDRGLSPWDEECLQPFGLAMASPAFPSLDNRAAGPEAGSHPLPVPLYSPMPGEEGSHASLEASTLPTTSCSSADEMGTVCWVCVAKEGLQGWVL